MASAPKRARIVVDGPAGVVPAGLGRRRRVAQARAAADRRRPEAAHAHAQQAHARRRVDRVQQRLGPRPRCRARCRGLGHGRRPGDGAEVGEAHLEGDRPPGQALGPQPGRDRVGHAHDLAAERRRPAVRSRAKVCSWPIDFSGRSGSTGRSSTPMASWWRWRPLAWPSAPTSVASGRPARSPTVATPSRWSRSSVAGPTPHRACTGSGCRKASSSPGATTTTPGAGPHARPAPASAWPPPTPAWPAAWSGPRRPSRRAPARRRHLRPGWRRRSRAPRRTAGGRR